MDVCFTNVNTESVLEECKIDFDKNEKQRQM